MIDTASVVVNQNNLTLAYLQAGDYSRAMESSLTALTILRSFDDLGSSDQDSTFANSNSNSSLDHCMLMNESPMEEDTDSSVSSSSSSSCLHYQQQQSPPDDSSFVYRHAIQIHPEAVHDKAITTPILIFNAALVHHLSALSRGGRQDYDAATATAHSTSNGVIISELSQAKRLYELAYGSQTVSGNTLFRFATINNIGMIERQLGNQKQAEYYMNRLLSVLMVLVNQKRSVELRHLSGFWSNLTMHKTTASAA